MSQPKTILFMPESAYGPTNNCIGIGDILRQRGHKVVFAAEASWKGKLETLGFVEDLVDLAPSMSACQVGAMNVSSCSLVVLRNSGAVSRMKSFQN